MATDAHSPLSEFPSLRHVWMTRIRRLDPVGPLVAAHAGALAAFSVTEHPPGVAELSVNDRFAV